MFRNAALILLGAIIANVPQADAAVTDETPYYMRFAYTEDGMLFAGGDFNLERGAKDDGDQLRYAQKLDGRLVEDDHEAQERQDSQL